VIAIGPTSQPLSGWNGASEVRDRGRRTDETQPGERWIGAEAVRGNAGMGKEMEREEH
jgi:hypothetical protein